MYLKKILTFLTLLFISFSLISEKTYSDKEEKYFIVTAYYSPLPNQTHYIMGDYYKEIRMNGKGIIGASGKKVFSGMLAAPSTYPFGTKINLEGLGIGEVSDRGGAIVKAGTRYFKYDRIDIWMGYGEEGLKRAMFWGNKKIKGTIINKYNKSNLNIKKIASPDWTLKKAIKNNNYIKKINIFSEPVKNIEQVKELQKVLLKMGLYYGKIDGKYLNIRESILEFQLNNNLILNKNDIGAGYFGPKTRKTLNKKYILFLLDEKKRALALKNAKKEVSKLGILKKGNISSKVRDFQKILKKLGFFKYKDTAIFGEKTKKALINYQISKKLIINSKSRGAGVFGPNTKKSLIEDLTEKSLEK